MQAEASHINYCCIHVYRPKKLKASVFLSKTAKTQALERKAEVSCTLKYRVYFEGIEFETQLSTRLCLGCDGYIL